MKNIKNKIIAIVGPTASGKTGIGVKLAKELGGEIVSADSRQVYKGLDLGTGKDLVEFGDVKYHLIDICESGERFTLFDYLPLARKAIEDIFSRNKLPIIVGGTGLYVQALVEGFELKKTHNSHPEFISGSLKDGIPKQVRHDTINREQLNNLTIEQLNDLLKQLDPNLLKTVDAKNPHRLIRAIERAQEGNTPTKSKPDFEVIQIGVNWPRETLYSRIDERVEERFKEGMLEEVINLLNRGVSSEWMLGLGLEYRVITDFLIHNSQFTTRLSDGQVHNKISNDKIPMLKQSKEFEQTKHQLKTRIHQFSRRQMTWFKRFPEIVWENDYNKISKIAKKFLK